ncbi:hypothetical protein Plim_1877 [Planctopirus limnophila DSM 3776]|uniref:FecR N-terminal domain-containing protein n=1 Tax=Planctopirus limnophila (strain ATCC 43296 / DSM 3776 / IFAM 1008 / Mu 290) TaxID=521674 RepID=D5SYH9_PLAL2|nr:FecR/PupR family sigma factor regulator [Planctopirus limnophila]ADG67707.1 hypothetical protein Plim_1877 [Planctopirus limnophila DSM 3776]
MTRDPGELVSRYLDDLLTEDEHRDLQDWLRSSPDHAREFARIVLLHDRLRGEQMAISITQPSPRYQPDTVFPVPRRIWRSVIIACGVMAAFVTLFLMSLEVGQTSAVASTELKRLISAQETELDRTYRISVEEAPTPRRKRQPVIDGNRPPKPPLDDAVLHVRKGNQFVLIRQMASGQQFVTGSNGQTSWAVRPDGPVRISTDLTRFNRDLPGHEHDFPLIQIERGLAQLQNAYEIQLLPIENGDDSAGKDLPTRLLVAVKKRGHRGPQRVEITYSVPTGQIHQLRFIEMPYGPEHLTVRLTQEEERPLGPTFFDHQSHHASDRVVEVE